MQPRRNRAAARHAIHEIALDHAAKGGPIVAPGRRAKQLIYRRIQEDGRNPGFAQQRNILGLHEGPATQGNYNRSRSQIQQQFA